jgi:hypothetical protein
MYRSFSSSDTDIVHLPVFMSSVPMRFGLAHGWADTDEMFYNIVTQIFMGRMIHFSFDAQYDREEERIVLWGCSLEVLNEKPL